MNGSVRPRMRNCHPHPRSELNAYTTSEMAGRGKGGEVKGGKSKSRSSRAGLQIPVYMTHQTLRRDNYVERVGICAPVYLTVLEYLAAEFYSLPVTPCGTIRDEDRASVLGAGRP